MIELQLQAALGRLEQTCQRIQARWLLELGSPHMLAAMGGLAVGWLARGLMLRSDR